MHTKAQAQNAPALVSSAMRQVRTCLFLPWERQIFTLLRLIIGSIRREHVRRRSDHAGPGFRSSPSGATGGALREKPCERVWLRPGAVSAAPDEHRGEACPGHKAGRVLPY